MTLEHHSPNSRVSSGRSALRGALQVVVIASITCVLTEVGARGGERWLTRRPFDTLYFWHVADPYLGWRNSPFRDPPVGLEFDTRGFQVFQGNGWGANAPTILFLGDSGTLGICYIGGTATFDSYTRTVAEQLPCTVINTGTVGYTSWQCVRVLRAYRGPLDAVVVRIGWNDHTHGNPMEFRNADSEVAATLIRSAVGRLILFAGQRPQDSKKPAVTLEEFETNLRTIVRIAHARGAKVIFVDYPIHLKSAADLGMMQFIHEDYARTIDEITALHGRYVQKARDVASDTHCPFVDTPLSEGDFSSSDSIHPNSSGARRIGLAVAHTLGAIGIRPIETEDRR